MKVKDVYMVRSRCITAMVWEASQLGTLVTALARRAGLELAEAGVEYDSDSVEAMCAARGLEAEPVALIGEALDDQLRGLPPGLVQVPEGGYLGVLGVHGATVRVLTPHLVVARLRLSTLRALLTSPAVLRIRQDMAPLLAGCAIPEHRRARAVAALTHEHVRQVRLGTAWQIRVSPGVRFAWQWRHAGLRRRLLTCLSAHLAAFVLLLAAWQVLGISMLRGRLETGWLLGWIGLVATSIPFRLLTTWSQGALAIGTGGLLKQRLLSGALRLDVDTVRQHGVGELLGRVIESEALETLALSGGLATVLALGELGIIIGLMHWGAAPLLQSVALGTWLLLLGAGVYVYGQRWRGWTTLRQALSGTLVERMSGHRTRLAQQAPMHWHTDEDAELEQYLALSKELDRASVWLTALLLRGWLLVGVLTLAPVYMAAVLEPARLAVSLGCLLLGYQALRRAALGVTQLAGAAIAWQQVAPLFHAAAHHPACGILPDMAPTQAAPMVLAAHNLVFHYPGRTAPVLRECNLSIRRGESILLEGSSGSGKSTLISVLSGLRRPTAGVLLAGGLDRATLGEGGWRRQVVAAPQYHENHILAAPLAFNLLLGRRWPPTPADLRDAEVFCRELGLGELIDRMPSGLMQMVGDTGWQLSHGERSRVFAARALLQGGALLLLDESFAALDPPNLQRCLACALRHAPTLLVVAHP